MEREPRSRRYRRFWGADPKRDVDDELAFHLAMRIDEYRRAGMTETQAEEAVMQRFGSVNQIREEVEELARGRQARRRRAWQLDALRQDVRYAWRTLVGNPMYTVIVALTLALGIGANAAVFSVAYGVLLRPLPFRDADQLVRIWSRNAKRNLDKFSVSPDDYQDWRAQSRAFAAMAAYERQHDATLATRDEPQLVAITAVTPDIFPLLGTTPVMGRTLVEDDARPESPAVAVMSNALWTTRFGSDPRIVGRDITVDGSRYTVVGVMPPRFALPGSNASLWTPLSMPKATSGHSNRYLRVLGRLAPGVTLEQAHTDLDVIAARIAAAFPANANGWSTNLQSVPEAIIGTQFRRAVVTLTGVVAFVLLIACANAANLQLARGAFRDRELAVRVALGASRGRIALQLLTESVIVSIVAGAVGLSLAYGGVALLRSGGTNVPRLEDVKLDTPVLIFTIVIAVGSGILFGLIPALRGSRADLGDVLRQGGRAGQSSIASGVRGALVVAEISLSLVLLIGAGLLMRSFVRLQAVDLGFHEAGVLVMPISLPAPAYPTSEVATAFYVGALQRSQALPGVESAAMVNSAPFSGVNGGGPFLPAEQAPPVGVQAPDADFRVVSSGYFRTMGMRVVRGRDVSPEDRLGAPQVVLVSESLVKKYFANENPIGRQIRVGDLLNGPLQTIVGIVSDARYYDLEAENARPVIYFSMYNSWYASAQRAMQLVVRGHDAALAGSVRTLVASLDPRLPAPTVNSLDQAVAVATASRRFALTLFGTFAGIAVLLAAIGLYGVLGYLVRQRTHELGIRVALGAPRRTLIGLVVGGALRLTLLGVLVGLIASFALTRSLGSLLFGVSPTDAGTFVLLSVFLTAVALLASLIPALRATRADPMLALRDEV